MTEEHENLNIGDRVEYTEIIVDEDNEETSEGDTYIGEVIGRRGETLAVLFPRSNYSSIRPIYGVECIFEGDHTWHKTDRDPGIKLAHRIALKTANRLQNQLYGL